MGAARAALADARLNLGYTRVSSPVAGVAGFRVANIGDFVGPNDPAPLTTVSQVDPIYAEFPISEQRALAVLRRWDADPRAPRDIELELILADGTVYPTRGRAAALDRQVDVTTGTVLARGVFPNPGNVLRPGQYAKVRAVVEVKKNALMIPQRAVQDVQGVNQVAVVRADETVDVRTVKVDARIGSLWIIAQGQARRAGDRRGSRPGASRTEGPAGVERAVRDQRAEIGLDHGQVLHQPARRRHGDLHPHGDHRPRRDGAASHRAVSEHRSAGDPPDRALPRRRRADARAVGRHADRAADERRRQHALHVLAQPGRRQPDAIARGLRRHHRSERRPGARQPAILAGRLPAAARREIGRAHV